MIALQKLVLRLSKPRSLLVAFVLYLIFVIGIFPAFAGHNAEAPPIDLAFHYSAKQVYQWIDLYGEAGRQSYIIGELSIDLVYPLVYTALFVGLLGFLTQFEQAGRFAGLAYLPFVIWFFDLLENMGIVLMLYNYPQQLESVAIIAAWCTSLKWSFAFLVVALCLVFALAYLHRRPWNSNT